MLTFPMFLSAQVLPVSGFQGICLVQRTPLNDKVAREKKPFCGVFFAVRHLEIEQGKAFVSDSTV